MASLLGGTIKSLNFTTSWGITPGSGQATLVGGSSVSAGQDFTVNIGGATIAGVTKSPELRTTHTGREWSVPIVDNREKLAWDHVEALFNIIEIVEDDVATPGIDRGRRYYSILPRDWHAQIKTYHGKPLSASEILNYMVRADTVRFSWQILGHSSLALPVYGIDCNTGKELGAAILEVTEKLGLMVTISGAYSLRFAIKGEGGSPHVPSDGSAKEYSSGFAVANNPTYILVTGDRNTYQDLPVQLVHSWNRGWERFIFEPDWITEVAAVFGPFANTASGRASRAARAREVTVREYAQRKGTEWGDYGKWGDVSRMDIPAWTYLQRIVFHAYGIVRGYTLNGIDLRSLELKEGLLSAVDYTTSGVLKYKTGSEADLYTDDKAFLIVRGAQLDLSDPAKIDSLDPTIFESRARNLWSPNNKFSLDAKNFMVVFDEAVFIPGAGGGGLFVYPNISTDIPADYQFKKIAVPNAAVTVQPAEVRGSFCFEAERYSKAYGGGLRRAARFVSGLSYHTLFEYNTWKTEIKYDSDPQEGADSKAKKASQSLIARSATYQHGSFTRSGSAGTGLTGAIDRVTYNLTEAGLSETVEYAKERAPSAFESERELDRRKLQSESFEGQRALSEEIRNLRYQGKLLASLHRGQDPRGYGSISDVARTVIGNTDSSPNFFDSDDVWLAGMPVFVDDQGVPDPNGKNFRGVVIAQNSTGPSIAAATQGIVPVRVRGPVNPGDAIGIDTGSGQTAKVGGALPIGVANAKYTGTQIVLLPVRVGAGGGGVAPLSHPFRVSTRAAVGEEETEGATYRLVEYRSKLLTSVTPFANLTISGLATEDDPEEDDDGWALLIANDVIYLEVAFAGGVPDTAEVKSYGAGDDWDGLNSAEWTGTGAPEAPFVQTFARVVIATAPADGDGNPRLVQCAHTDFFLLTYNLSGKLAQLPSSWGAV